MLAPKKVKFRKMQKGRMRGKAYRGGQITLGEFGLKALEPGWVTSRSCQNCDYAFCQAWRAGLDKNFPGQADHQEACRNSNG